MSPDESADQLLGRHRVTMADEHCPFKERCPMFPIFRLQAARRVFQVQYCEGAFHTCERHKLASTGEMPPPELLRNGKVFGRGPTH